MAGKFQLQTVIKSCLGLGQRESYLYDGLVAHECILFEARCLAFLVVTLVTMLTAETENVVENIDVRAMRSADCP